MRALVLLGIALTACGSTPPRTTAATDLPALAYEVALDPSLGTMQVSICPRGAPLPTALVPIHDAASAHIVRAGIVRGEQAGALPAFEGRLDLRDAPRDACVRYEVDLASCATPRGPSDCARSGRDLLAPTSTWLLAPETRRLAARYELRFVLPEGVFVTPIADAGGGMGGGPNASVILDDRSFAFVTYVAFVHRAPRQVPVPGACIDVVALEGALDASADTQAQWLSAATAASARVTGQAPFERLTAIVVPSLDVPGSPVLFGVAGRGMRPSVTLLVGAHAERAQLVADWTAVHELAHFLTSYLDGEDTWLCEGLATYYEEVLRARQGLLTEAQAWAALESGFARGRADSGSESLRTASSSMHVARSYARVYWGGAALVLLADVAYRRIGSSLDEAIARAWPHRGERASAQELLLWLDGAPDGTFASLAATMLDAEGFPDLTAVNTWLGVELDARGSVTLRDDAPGAAVRRAMMNASVPAPSNPSRCDEPNRE